MHSAGGGAPTLSAAEVNCTPSADANNAECTAMFLFDPLYTPTADGNLNLDTNANIQLGNLSGATFTQYFEITAVSGQFPPLQVTANQGYSGIQITWSITI